ncbi:hypothetical protein PV10_05497 [Exophiala mesophila]|uniref:Uncharacterized protein n=1 Tax=Exophiala mesophila TaxID=212818 RepID=A0A0D1ZVQ0_EXOME|nr:uncharacterized protein PV10_05497 [Exophiala mesophila]KIV90893.1 hypothetical protein PV10_05497 [Exophiala mesophila]
MPINGFSNEHDYEVQAYMVARKKYLAAEKERKQRDKAQRRAIQQARQRHLATEQIGDGSVLKYLKSLVFRQTSSHVSQEPASLLGLDAGFSESDADEISLKKALDES